MRKLELSKKTGFKVTDIYKPIVIRDFRGINFYSTEPYLPKVKEFNLPAGSYVVDTGYFTPLPNPVRYAYVKLPFPERLFSKPNDFQVCFGVNKNKCTIYWNKKVILFDNSFKEKPLYQLFSILFHEYGHAKYKTEKYADLYAANCMIAKGFNPSQIIAAPIESLSSNANERKETVFNMVLNAQKW